MSLRKIEAEILKLSQAERRQLRQWFLESDAADWDDQLEHDAVAGRLDELANTALKAHRAGESTPL